MATRLVILTVLSIVVLLGIIAGSPAIMAKKHHHLTDTQKEDSTTSDAQGNPCIYGPHDENINQDCEDKGGDIGLVCDVKNDGEN